MGMLDTVTPFSEAFKEGDVITLQDARVGPSIKTDYGNDSPAQLKIDGKWYSIFGQGLVAQIERMDDDDKRTMRAGQFRCKVARTRTRSGNEVKVLVSADTQTDSNGAVQDF